MGRFLRRMKAKLASSGEERKEQQHQARDVFEAEKRKFRLFP